MELRTRLSAITIPHKAVPGKDPQHPPHALGATEDQVNMRGIVPQRIDKHGSKIEESGGDGKHDALGG